MNRTWLSPSRTARLENQHVLLTSVNVEEDLARLFQAVSIKTNGEDILRYHVNAPPMDKLETYEGYIRPKLALSSEVVYKVFSKRLNAIVGSASLMNIRPEHGVVEVGSIWYSKTAQRTEINTNAMFLLFSYVFDDLHYRRLEWKCNNKNEASKAAALRLGFEYEGLFRNHFMTRGESRDTAWYSIIDSEWDEKKKQLSEKAGRHV